MLFTVEYRDKVKDELIGKAKADTRIVSAALVGSSAAGMEDRWSDIDLTLAFESSVVLEILLQEWTLDICETYDAVVLLDVWRDTTLFRVFMLPGFLQLDISFTPVKEFGATGKKFKLLFGQSTDKPVKQFFSISDAFGWAIHHILRARFCIERNRLWQAEYWISEARNYTLNIACFVRGLESAYGRAYDDLPDNILTLFKESFVRIPEKPELLRCLQVVTEGLISTARSCEKQLPSSPELAQRMKAFLLLFRD